MASRGILLPLFVALALSSSVSCHLLMTWPPQRGCLWGNNFEPNPRVVDKGAPRDFLAHFPAGDLNPTPGSGLRSQIKEAGPAGWTPFEPEKPGFRWRAGVCGDLKTKPEHLRGGKFYHNGKPSVTYEEDGIVSIDITVIAHHNGFIEVRLCDVSKSGGEISEATFKSGHCQKLKRAVDPSCESRTDKMCAPINPVPEYANRWDLPCRASPSGRSYYGKGKIKYHLPAGWSGSHFVLHFFHTAANSCMPLGITDYFKGPRGPQWGDCKGQGDAIGGYRRFPSLCGGSRFPEEYYKCADIAITPRSGPPKETPVSVPIPIPSVSSAPNVPTTSPVPSIPAREPLPSPSEDPVAAPSIAPMSPTPVSSSPIMPSPIAPAPVDPTPVSPVPVAPSAAPIVPPSGPPASVGPLTNLVLIGDGTRGAAFGDGDDVEIDVSTFRLVTFQMRTTGKVPEMHWSIDGRLAWVEYSAPYYLGGNRGDRPKYWRLPINRKFALKVVSGSNVMSARVTLTRN